MDGGHPCWVLYFSEMASGFFYLGRFRLWVLGFPCLQFSNLAYWKKNCFSCYIFPALPQFFELFKKIFSILNVCFQFVILHLFYLNQVIYCLCTLFPFQKKFKSFTLIILNCVRGFSQLIGDQYLYYIFVLFSLLVLKPLPNLSLWFSYLFKCFVFRLMKHLLVRYIHPHIHIKC